MKVLWVRSKEKISFLKPKVYFASGQIGTGKSSLLEHLGIQHLQKGASIIDIYGSADGENLAWLRSEHVKDRKVCLLKGQNVDVDSVYDVKLVENLGLHDLDKYDFIISSRPLFLNKDQEFYSLGQLTNLLYKRISWNKLIYLIAREAGNLWYSRLRVSDQQSDAKSEAIYLLREMRHLGFSLGLDSLRFQSIDIDVRSHVDYLILKSQGLGGLSHDLRWLYKYFSPRIVRKMPPQNFILLSRMGGLALGEFPYPSWHKREKENILRAVGVTVEYGEVLDRGRDRGTYKTVGDKEHSEIVEFYCEGLSMPKIADRLDRSTKTVSDHIHGHNDAVARSGFCAVCKRLKSPLESQKAVRIKS